MWAAKFVEDSCGSWGWGRSSIGGREKEGSGGIQMKMRTTVDVIN